MGAQRQPRITLEWFSWRAPSHRYTVYGTSDFRSSEKCARLTFYGCVWVGDDMIYTLNVFFVPLCFSREINQSVSTSSSWLLCNLGWTHCTHADNIPLLHACQGREMPKWVLSKTKQFTDSCWASLYHHRLHTHAHPALIHTHRFFSISSLFHFSDFCLPSPAFSFETSEFWVIIIFLSFASTPFLPPSLSQSLLLYLSACLFQSDELYARTQVESHSTTHARTHASRSFKTIFIPFAPSSLVAGSI